MSCKQLKILRGNFTMMCRKMSNIIENYCSFILLSNILNKNKNFTLLGERLCRIGGIYFSKSNAHIIY